MSIGDRISKSPAQGGVEGGGYGPDWIARNLGKAGDLLNSVGGAGITLPTAPTTGFSPIPYGMPKGSDLHSAAQFPPWIQALGAAFQVSPSTYPGHQEGSGQNRGIDWWPTGVTPDESGASYSPEQIARLQTFAQYLQGVMPTVDPQGQTIFQNRNTGQTFGVAPGQGIDTSGQYYADARSQPGQGYGGHHGHVHTRMNVSEPIPGDVNQLVAPGSQQYGPGPGNAGAAAGATAGGHAGGTTLTAASIGGDLGLPDDLTTDPMAYPWQNREYRHGDPGIFGLAGSFISSMPGGDRLMRPFRGGSLGAAGGAAPPPAAAPAPASAIASAMATRAPPDLANVGSRGGDHVSTTNYHFDGVTPSAVAQLAPRLTSSQVSESRATIPRSI
jgi:hypothetical protein